MAAAAQPEIVTFAIARHSRHHPARRALIFIGEDGSTCCMTAGALHNESARYGRALHALGIQPDEVLVIALPYELALVPSLLGALYLGAVPSIFPYLTARNALDLYAERLCVLVRDADARGVLTVPELTPHLRRRLGESGCRLLSCADLAASNSAEPSELPRPRGADQLALLQFTSGTTDRQKGVPVTHGQLSAFIDADVADTQIDANDVCVSWLPINHDMGLHAGLLLPLSVGATVVMMSPTYWVRNPVSMLRAVHDFKGTMSWMPNFAFNHCTRRICDTDLTGIDLSSWRFNQNGAEPVRWDSIEKFWRRFSAYGLRKSAMKVGYGLAENVLTVSQTRGDGPPVVDWIDGPTLQSACRALPVMPTAPGAQSFVSCGRPLAGTEVMVTDDAGQPLPERHIGEIRVRTPYSLRTYYRDAEATADVVHDGWLCTGDRGYLAGGEIYVCGRKKDLIIVGGVNILPEDVEATADAVAAVQPGRCVVFGVFDDALGTERVVMLCELRERTSESDRRHAAGELRQLVVQRFSVTLSDLRFVDRGWIIKTSSGKVSRAANREKYRATFAARPDCVLPEG